MTFSDHQSFHFGSQPPVNFHQCSYRCRRHHLHLRILFLQRKSFKRRKNLFAQCILQLLFNNFFWHNHSRYLSFLLKNPHFSHFYVFYKQHLHSSYLRLVSKYSVCSMVLRCTCHKHSWCVVNDFSRTISNTCLWFRYHWKHSTVHICLCLVYKWVFPGIVYKG